MARPLVAQINLAALAANLDRAREKAPGAQVLAVVKANAYGHGLMRVLPALQAADGLALVELDAAVALREAHYSRRILLLEGFFEARELPEIARARKRGNAQMASKPPTRIRNERNSSRRLRSRSTLFTRARPRHRARAGSPGPKRS